MRFVAIPRSLSAWLALALLLALLAWPAGGTTVTRAQTGPASDTLVALDDDDDDDDDGDDGDARDTGGAVYAMTNDATANQIVVFNRGADGRLTPAGSVATGGRGSGTFENSANGLILTGAELEQSPNNFTNGGSRFLFATNAGSNSISAFRVTRTGLVLVDVEPSGGDHPISVAFSDNLLYALNGGASNCTGGTPTVSGFRVSPAGTLTPISGSTRPVSGGAVSGCAQVSFNPDGDVLVVTQRQSDKIDTYRVGDDGRVSGPIVNETTGVGPFGFTFTLDGELLTTENFGAAPLQGGAASYEVRENGTLRPLGPTVRNGRSDTCWFVITDNQRHGYVTNFQSGDISSYRVRENGTLVLLNPTAAVVGIGASDQALSLDSRYLYARNALQGTISVFRVQADGSLTRIQDVAGLPPGGGAIGLAAR